MSDPADDNGSEVEQSDAESEERGRVRQPRFGAAQARRILDLSSSDNDDSPTTSKQALGDSQLAAKLKRTTAEVSQGDLNAAVDKESAASTPPQTKRPKLIQGAEGRRKREKRRERPNIAVSSGTENETLHHELQKTNELLVQLVGRMKKTEKRVKTIEDTLLSPSGNSSSCGSTPQRYQSRRKSVPPEVRVSISRHAYVV